MHIMFMTGGWWEYANKVPTQYSESFFKSKDNSDRQTISADEFQSKVEMSKTSMRKLTEDEIRAQEEAMKQSAEASQYQMFGVQPDWMQEMSESDRDAFIRTFKYITDSIASTGSNEISDMIKVTAHEQIMTAAYGLALAKISLYEQITGGAHSDKLREYAEYYLKQVCRADLLDKVKKNANAFDKLGRITDPEEFQQELNKLVTSINKSLNDPSTVYYGHVTTSTGAKLDKAYITPMQLTNNDVKNMNSVLLSSWNNYVLSLSKLFANSDLMNYIRPVTDFAA